MDYSRLFPKMRKSGCTDYCWLQSSRANCYSICLLGLTPDNILPFY